MAVEKPPGVFRSFSALAPFCWFRSLALTGPLHRGAFVVPSEDYSHEPPRLRSLQSVKGDRPNRTAEHKKKTMKTNLHNLKGLQSRPEQLNTQQRSYAEHEANRELNTQTVLDFLKSKLPQQYELAEIVGTWIWLDFPKASDRAAANTLYRLGFHWNQRRCVWQHPCGAFAPYAPHPGEPRAKYGSRLVSQLA